MEVYILAVFVWHHFVKTQAGSYDNMVSLHTDLLSNYSKNIRPVQNQDNAMDISFMYSTAYFHEFDAVAGKFTVLASIYLGWLDGKLYWNPANYDNIKTSYFSTSQVWSPAIVLSSGVDSELITATSSITTYSSGYSAAIYNKILTSSCSPDITYYPYDVHNCSLYFTVMEPYTVIDLNINPQAENLDLTENLFWIVSRTGIWKYIPGNYSATIVISYSVERRPTYLLYTIMLPVCLLNFVTLLAFFLPADSGERVSFATTMLLTLTMYMTIMSDSIPNTSDPVSIFTISLMVKLIISALIVLSVIITLCAYKNNEDKLIPYWLLYCCKLQPRRVEAEKNDADMVQLPGENNVVTWLHIGKRLDVAFVVFYSVATLTETIVNVVRISYRL